ncbi:hypothetical protein MRS44_001551 [Fusarium solani]|uniref:uncharacterized protein n=1 Tax=Fusarium solani TaxID=169388 RepID=UPI0032C4341A|nr:hypothetical protein MRS44_001551 [Fusarium solani]
MVRPGGYCGLGKAKREPPNNGRWTMTDRCHLTPAALSHQALERRDPGPGAGAMGVPGKGALSLSMATPPADSDLQLSAW